MSLQKYTQFKVKPYSPKIGGIVEGIDLSQTISSTASKELQNALAQYQVLFFHEQHLTPQNQIDFTKVFGNVSEVKAFFPRLDSHPEIEIVESTTKQPSAANNWHADITWRENPPVGTSLYAQILPEVGGDTIWSSLTAAFEDLPIEFQNYLATLTAVHTWEISRWTEYLLSKEHGQEEFKAARAKYPPVEHPVIRVHPITGKKIIYVNPTFTSHIKNIPRIQSDALLAQLYSLIVTPEYQARLRWQANTLAIWDNRSTQHYAIGDYFPQHRKLHRITFTADQAFQK